MADDSIDGVEFTHLDQELFDGAGATKRDLVSYLDAIAGPFVEVLRDRPLSVIRVRPGQEPFMQKNLPKYAPELDPDGDDVGRGVAPRRRVRARATTVATLLWFA